MENEKTAKGSLVDLAGSGAGRCRAAVFPGKYLQGPGTLALAGKAAAELGEKTLVIGGKTALAESWEQIKTALADEEIDFDLFQFSGESTVKEIETAATRAAEISAELVIGVGGGKAIDTAKAAACKAGARAIIIPTIASTDAPTSTISVIHDERGHFMEYYRSRRNPDVVIADTRVLARAPARYLCAGIGGALAVSYEAEAAAEAGALNMAGGLPFQAVIKWAVMAREIIFEQARMAKLSADRNLVTPSLESIVEANLFLSGIGFESGGLAAAHGVYHGFRSGMPGLKRLHGEVVAFGTLVQLVLEKRPEAELRPVVELYKSLDLPLSFKDLGLHEPGMDLLKEVARHACEAGTTRNMPFDVDSAMMLDALLFVDAFSRN